jgi:hypothetical protein
VWFYLRGEEYSAQIDLFVHAVLAGPAASGPRQNDFASAAVTDRMIEMVLVSASAEENPVRATTTAPTTTKPRKSLFGGRNTKAAAR